MSTWITARAMFVLPAQPPWNRRRRSRALPFIGFARLACGCASPTSELRSAASGDLFPPDRLPEPVHLGLELPDPLHQLLDGLRHGVRQIHLVQIDLAGNAATLAIRDSPGNADDHGVRRHFTDHDRARPDPTAVTDLERPDDLGAGSDDDVVAEGRVPLLAPRAGAPERDALQQAHVRSDLRRLPDHDPHAMVDEEPAPEACRRMDLDAGQAARHVRDEPRERRVTSVPEPVRQTVTGERVNARRAEQHLEPRASGGVTLQDHVDVSAEGVKHAEAPAQFALFRSRRLGSSPRGFRGSAVPVGPCLGFFWLGSPSAAPRTATNWRAAARMADATTSAACFRSSGRPSRAVSTSRGSRCTRSLRGRPTASSLPALAAAMV